MQHDAGVLFGFAGFGIGCHLGIKFGQNGLARDDTHLAFGITVVSLAGVQILVGAPSASADDISPAVVFWLPSFSAQATRWPCAC